MGLRSTSDLEGAFLKRKVRPVHRVPLDCQDSMPSRVALGVANLQALEEVLADLKQHESAQALVLLDRFSKQAKALRTLLPGKTREGLAMERWQELVLANGFARFTQRDQTSKPCTAVEAMTSKQRREAKRISQGLYCPK